MGSSDIENYLAENTLHCGEDYVRLYKALWAGNLPLGRRVADAGAAVFPKHWKLAQLKTPARPKDKKVFGIGLSKTGTTSLTDALGCLGYRAAHWRKMPEKQILSWDHIDLYDALTDVSISFILEPLYFAYPGARFVYTVRDLGDWERSIENHFAWLGGFAGLKRRISERTPHSRPVESQPLWQQLHTALYARYSSWHEAYAAHQQRVETFFSGSRRDSVLTIDFTTGSSRERWDRLCAFLNEEAPLCPIPHRNRKLSDTATGAATYTRELRDLIREGSEVPDQTVGLAPAKHNTHPADRRAAG